MTETDDGTTDATPDGATDAAGGAVTEGGVSPDLAAAVHEWAGIDAPVLIALDFDGVLAPISPVPSASRMPAVTRTALRRLLTAPGAQVAMVSGRALADLKAIARPPEGVLLVGSHGAEVSGAPPVLTADEEGLLAEIHEAVQVIVDAHPGTTIETKPTAVVLHTRNADRGPAAAATAAALNGPARLAGIRTTTGKEVVELAVLDVDKGIAVHRLRTETGAGAVLYAGDDVSDEHAFAVLDDDEGDVTIKVGAGPTGARWRLDGPEDVPALLDTLTDALEAVRSSR